MYIGPQGIVHGTFNTLLNAGRMKLGVPQDGNLNGHLFVSSGLGGMSGPFSRVVAANRETPLFRLTLAHRLVENDLAQADRLGRHLDILVLLDIFERFL